MSLPSGYVRKFYLLVAHLAKQNSEGTWTTACSRTLKGMDDPASPMAHEGHMCETCQKYFDKYGLKFIVKEGSTKQ